MEKARRAGYAPSVRRRSQLRGNSVTLTVSEQMAHSTVRIESELASGGVSTGTAFFFACCDSGQRSVPCLVTNKHVIAGGVRGRFHLTLRSPENEPVIGSHLEILLDNFESSWFLHPDPQVDLAVLPIWPLIELAKQQGQEFYFVTVNKGLILNEAELQDLGAMEDIVMVGYPNGIWDAVNNMPIFRRGITATHPNLDYEGRAEFLIDAACFPGSSGSPVFLYNAGGWATRGGGMVMGGTRVKLLGVLYAGPQHTTTGEIEIVTVPTQQRAVAISTIPNNLGLVVKASRLLEFDALLPADGTHPRGA